MALKIKRGKKPTTEPAPAPAVFPPRTPKPIPSSRTKTRVLLSVEDGKIDWKALTPESRRQFEELFKNPEFLAQFGIKPGARGGFDPEQVKYIYDAIGTAYQTIAALALRWPKAACDQLVYTADEKNILAGPTANLANQYVGAFLAKHQALLIWGSIFLAITQAKIARASAIAKADSVHQKLTREGRIAKAPPSPAPAPVPAAPEPTIVHEWMEKDDRGPAPVVVRCKHCNDTGLVIFANTQQQTPCPNCRPSEFAKIDLEPAPANGSPANVDVNAAELIELLDAQPESEPIIIPNEPPPAAGTVILG